MQGWIVSNSCPDLDESATQTAVILSESGVGAVVGAVYKAVSTPITVIAPTVEFPFATPLTAQLTVVSGCPALMSLAMVRAALPFAELFAWLDCGKELDNSPRRDRRHA